MIPLPTILRLLQALVVAVLIAFAAMPSTARPSALKAVIRARTASTSLRERQDNDPPAALDVEVSELEVELDGAEPPPQAGALVQFSAQPLPIFCAGPHGVGAVACWVSTHLSSGHPRGPPIS